MVTGATITLVPAAWAERSARRLESPDADLWEVLDSVHDPEIPVLSLWALGVLRDVRREAGVVVVELTPTYSGCPAFEVMQADVRAALCAAGHRDVRVDIRLAPPWTTDWLDAAARARLQEHNIAPPDDTVACPNCGAGTTRVVAEHASTACLALYRCDACREPFHHFKAI